MQVNKQVRHIEEGVLEAPVISEAAFLEGAYEELNDISTAKKLLDDRKKELEEKILNVYENKIQEQIKSKDEPFGVVNFSEGNVSLAVTIPKKIKWDQEKLAGLAEEIVNGGENPFDYLKIEYSVPESKYKNWPSVIKEQFIAARTVQPGNPSIKLTVKE